MKKVILILFLCLSIGYGAFETSINLKAKGNVYKASDRCFLISDNSDGSASITGYDVSCGSDVVIPDKVNGKIISKIGKLAFYNKGITSVSFSSYLTEIGDSAFTSNKIKSLDIPGSVKVIGMYAFRGNKINSLTLHEGTQSLFLHAFAENYLTEINIPDSVTYLGGGVFSANSVTGDKAFIYGKNNDGSFNYSILDSYAGRDATGTSIPSTVRKFGEEAYANVIYLRIEIPAEIKVVSSYCFTGSWAQEIILHEGLEEISYQAFGYTSITSIDIPSTVKSISSSAFVGSNSLKVINVKNTLNSISGAPWGSNAVVNWNN